MFCTRHVYIGYDYSTARICLLVRAAMFVTVVATFCPVVHLLHVGRPLERALVVVACAVQAGVQN